MKVALLQVEDRVDQYLELCILRNKLYCSKHNIDHIVLRQGLKDYPPYWWKVVYLYEIMLTNKHDIVVWMDSDAFVYNDRVDVRGFFTQTEDTTMLICPDPPNWKSEFMAAVFAIKNNAKGREIVEKWLSYYNPSKWIKNNSGKWQCKGSWAGVDYEQGSFTKLVLPQYESTIRSLPWYIFHETDCINPHVDTWSIHIPNAIKYKRYLCTDKVIIDDTTDYNIAFLTLIIAIVIVVVLLYNFYFE